jgi:cytochrome c2
MKIRNLVIGAFVAIALMFGVSSTAFAGDAAKGKALFEGQGKCKTCHKIDSGKLVGPGLAGIKDRHSQEWEKKWIAAPQQVWESKDKEVEELKKRVGKSDKPKTAMLPGKLTDAEIDDVVTYLWTL